MDPSSLGLWMLGIVEVRASSDSSPTSLERTPWGSWLPTAGGTAKEVQEDPMLWGGGKAFLAQLQGTVECLLGWAQASC